MCADARAQRPEPSGPAPGFLDSIKPLQIGETISEALWHVPLQVVNHPEGKDTITLNDYRGKLIILDFWATWCSACIRSFPKLEQVCRQYRDDLALLLVTGQPDATAEKFFDRQGMGIPPHLFSVTYDTVLSCLFPHRSIPHVVWIDRAGRFIAVTNSDEVNAFNISSVLDQKALTLKNKVDLDPAKQLFIRDDAPFNQLLHYSILLQGRIEGVPSGSVFRRTGEVVHGRAMTNTRLLNMYEAIVRNLMPGYNRKRMVIEVQDTAVLAGYHTYEYTAPVTEAGTLYEDMLLDLNRKTGLNGRIERRNSSVLLLIAKGSPAALKSGGGKEAGLTFDGTPTRMVNQRIQYLVSALNRRPEIDLPVIDATGYAGAIDLSLSGKLDLPSLRKDLNRQCLDLVEREIPLDVFVLSN
jgi:Thiol-disulfide isomerase and thioredoxins